MAKYTNLLKAVFALGSAAVCIASQQAEPASCEEVAAIQKDKVAGRVYVDTEEATDKKEKCKPDCNMMQNCKKNKEALSTEEEKEYRLLNPRYKSAAQEAVEGP